MASALIAAFFLLAPMAYAGGPFVVDAQGSGIPARWSFDAGTKKWTVHWTLDPGPLSATVSHDEAEAMVRSLFDLWKNVKMVPRNVGDPMIATVALDFVFDGPAGEDITAGNYENYLSLDLANPGPTTVIFDADGSIMEHFCIHNAGESEEKCRTEFKNEIAGVGAALTVDAATRTIRNGFIILNGRLKDGVSDPDNREMASLNHFKGVILHEIGHVLNLDHTQVNIGMVLKCDANSYNQCSGGTAIPTMFPSALTEEQSRLHQDDKVFISYLYPSQAFNDNYCTIVGNLTDAAGKGIPGRNVIARNVAEPFNDARSFVSGALYLQGKKPDGSTDGHYVLAGLRPGQKYEVSVETLHPQWSQRHGSSYNPLNTDSPTDPMDGLIGGPDGAAAVGCEAGGKIIEMPAFQVAGSGAVPPGSGDSGGGAGTQKKGWFCAFVPGASFSEPWRGWIPFIFVFLALGAWRRRYSG